MATAFVFTQQQLIIGVVVVSLLCLWWLDKKSAEPFDTEAPLTTTLTGTNMPASIYTGGQQVAALSVIEESTPLPYFNNGLYQETWAELQVTSEDTGGAVASGQPMPVQVVQTPRLPTYTVRVPPISAPMTIPATSLTPTGATTSSITQTGPNAPQVPPVEDKSYNKVASVDWPGNDISCEMYSEGNDASTCRSFCQQSPKCVGYVDVKAGTNPVFPAGFCCSKHTMVDPMSSIGVDAYHKMNMSPQ